MKLGKVGYLSMAIKKSDLVSMTEQELLQLIEDANRVIHLRSKYDEMQHKMEIELRGLLGKMQSYAYDNQCAVFIELEDENVSYDVSLMPDVRVIIKGIDEL